MAFNNSKKNQRKISTDPKKALPGKKQLIDKLRNSLIDSNSGKDKEDIEFLLKRL